MNRQKRRGGPPSGGHGGSRPSHPRVSVPPWRSITPGTAVNIILKADQPTGRTVSGAVSEVLTRGDHPRGVKVRLTDGRVGRVQSLRRGGELATQEEEEEEHGLQLRTEGGGDPSGRRDRFTARDMRLDGPDEPPSEPMVLDMYMRPAKGKKQKKRGGKSQSGQQSTGQEEEERGDGSVDAIATVRCPVCTEFEGDEAAVAHHVAGHFGE